MKETIEAHAKSEWLRVCEEPSEDGKSSESELLSRDGPGTPPLRVFVGELPRARAKKTSLARAFPTRFCAPDPGFAGDTLEVWSFMDRFREVLFAEDGSDTEREDGADAARLRLREQKKRKRPKQSKKAKALAAAAAAGARATSARLSRACRPRRTRWRVPCSLTTTIPPRPPSWARCCARCWRSTPRRRRRRTRGRRRWRWRRSARRFSAKPPRNISTPLRRPASRPETKKNKTASSAATWRGRSSCVGTCAARRAPWRHRPRADCSALPRAPPPTPARAVCRWVVTGGPRARRRSRGGNRAPARRRRRGGGGPGARAASARADVRQGGRRGLGALRAELYALGGDALAAPPA